MVAASLELEEADLPPDAASNDVHPWVKKMYRKGLSFNGGERSRLFLGRGDGTFDDLSDLSGADSPLDGRALLAVDFDDDGDLDLFSHNIQRQRHDLFRNELDAPSFVKVRLVATRGQHEAIGATVVLEGPRGPVAQVLARGAGFASGQAPELVFGLGAAPSGRLRVRWPGSAAFEEFGEVAAGARLVLVEGAGEPRTRPAAPAPLPAPWAGGLRVGVGSRVPPLRVVDAAGASIELDPRGPGDLYLTFWASFCSPCIAELPTLEALHQRPGARVLAISVDAPADRAHAAELLAARGASFPTYFPALDEEANEGSLDALVDLLRLPVPTTLVVDSEGRIREVLQGPVPADR